MVVGNHNNKNSNLNPSAQLNSKTTNQTDIKDTNFEYEDKDNEWDIGNGLVTLFVCLIILMMNSSVCINIWN